MATCRGCGARIVWGTTSDGKKIPLDPTAPVYRVLLPVPTTSTTLDVQLLALKDRDGDWRIRGAMVSHFSTCPRREAFSKGRRAE